MMTWAVYNSDTKEILESTKSDNEATVRSRCADLNRENSTDRYIVRNVK